MQKQLLKIEHSSISNPELTGAGSIGVNLHEIQCYTRRPAIRSRIGWRGLNKMGFTRLFNGDILAAPCYWYYKQTMNASEDTAGSPRLWGIDILRSKDDGRTWTKVETKGDVLAGKEAAIQGLSDGRVILMTSHPHGFRFSTSDDSGVTWKTMQLGPYCRHDELYKYDEGAYVYAVIRNVLEENDGSLSAWMIKNNSEDLIKVYKKEINNKDVRIEACLFISRDRGTSWEETGRKFKWSDLFGTWFEELQVMRHSDGRLMALMRVGWEHQIGDIPCRKDIFSICYEEIGDHMMLMESKDNGISWSEPRTVTNYGEPHGHLLELSDGRLLCTYSNYHLPYGIYAILSEDGGKTWDTEHPIQLAVSLMEHLGWPTSIQLPCGDILTGYMIAAYEKEKDEGTVGKKHTVDECVRWQVPEGK